MCPSLQKHLLTVICKVWKNKIVPSSWQQAVIILLHKSGPAEDLANFRPIALTNCDGKIFFSIVAGRITSYMRNNKYFDGLTQKGFLPGIAGCIEHATLSNCTCKFSGLAVEEVGVLKLLGVTFDKHLFYGPHLQRIALRAPQRIGFLRKSFKVLDTPGRFAAYKGFVRPMLEYCPLVWAGAAPYHLSHLDKIQKRALSLIGPGVSVDSLALRRSVSSLCLLHKLMSGPRLPTLANLLPPQRAPPTEPRTRR